MIREEIASKMESSGVKNVRRLAQLTGITESALYRFFNGASLSIEKLELIAEVLGCTWAMKKEKKNASAGNMKK
jgi:transcriptional regulator with XRE-family HTH domain